MRTAALILSILFLGSCQIYRSPDRNQFENDSSTLKIKSLEKTSCSPTSVAPQAAHSQFVTALDDGELLWQYDVNSKPVYESTNLKGAYCLYDVELQ